LINRNSVSNGSWPVTWDEFLTAKHKLGFAEDITKENVRHDREICQVRHLEITEFLIRPDVS
jgi:hypothetical protein